MSEHVQFTQEERIKRLYSWFNRLTAVLCSLVMTISMVTPSFIYAADLDPALSILDFEGTNPITSFSIKENEKVEDSMLPATIDAVVALDDAADDAQEDQLDAASFVMEQPDEIPSAYEQVEGGLYHVTTLNNAYPYRTYGKFGDHTGWFSLDEKTHEINGRVQTVDLDWNLDELKTDEAGKQTLTTSVLDAALPEIRPQAEMTIEPVEEEIEETKTDPDSEAESEDSNAFGDPAADDQKPSDDPDAKDQEPTKQQAPAVDSDPDALPDADSNFEPAADANGQTTNDDVDDTNAGTDQNPANEPTAVVRDGSNDIQPTDGSTITCNNHDLFWRHGSDVSTIDGNLLTNATTINGVGTGQLTAHLVFSFSGPSTLEPGSIQITLPYHVLKGRDGSWVDTLSLPFPMKGKGESTTGFVYEVDEANNQVLITNTKPFRSGSFLEADLTYLFRPYAVKNGTKTSAIQADFEILNPETKEVELSQQSQPLQAEILTSVKEPAKIEKTAQSTRRTWNPQWGKEPADADQYIYTTWLVVATIDIATQPFSTYVKDVPSHNGEVIGWYKPDTDPSAAAFTAGDGDALQEETLTTMAENREDNGQSQHSVAIVVKTPLAQLNSQETAKTTITNEVDIIVKGIDGDEKSGKTIGTFDYQPVDYRYSGDEIGVSKTDLGNGHGALELLRSGQDYEPWDGDNNVMPFDLTLVSRGYDLSAEGIQDYTSVMDDYLMFLNGTRLNPGDYEYTAFTPSSYLQYTVFKDPNVGLTGKPDPNYEDYAPVEVYTTTGDGQKASTWSHYGTLTYPAANTFTWNDKTVGANEKIALPKGTTGVSFRQTGRQFQVDLKMKLYYKLIASKNVQNLVGDEGLVGLYNVNTGYQSLPGQSPAPETKPTGTIDAGIKDQIAALDQERFGGPVPHGTGHQWLMGFYSTTLANKYFRGVTNNTNESRFEVQYELNQFDTLVGEGDITRQFALDHGLITEQTEGTFYDLLPPGTTVDFESIKAYGTDHQEVYPHTIELLPNWQSSGRTLMVVNVKKPADANNVIDAGSNTNTGMILSYTLFDPWENVLDNGKVLTNSYVYESKDGPLYSGSRVIQDAPGQTTDQRYFSTLPDGSDPDVNNKVYASVTNNLSADIAAIYGFTKEVRTITDPDFAKETKTFGGQEYMYKLRFSANTTQTTGNVIMYDFLENMADKTNDWKGTFKSVDVSQLIEQGVAPVVYYTTKQGLAPKADSTDTSLFDLANTKVWSTTPPADLSTVTGIAVDISKMKDGSPFVFDQGKSGVVMIYMEAPDDGSTGTAYNNAFMSETQTGNTQNEVETSNATTITLDAQPIGLVKTSDPASGTQDAPKVITTGDPLTYYLNVQNEDELAMASDIEISDTFDSALTIDPSKIQCTLYADQSDTTGTPANDHVQITMDGQKLTAVIGSLGPEEWMQIAIPTAFASDFAIPEDQKSVRLENQAVLEKVGKVALSIPSAKTYHQVTRPKPIQTQVVFTKKLEPAADSAKGTRDLQANEFQFNLLQDGKVVETAQNDADGKITFDTLSFTQAGTFTYTVQEVDDNQPGITYDATEYPVEIVVTQNKDQLKALMTAAKGTTITNQYTIAPAHVHVVFHKDLVPRPGSGTVAIEDQKQLQNKQFEFQLVQKSTAPDGTTQNKVVETVANDPKGQIAFTMLSFTEPGTYQYYVQEVNDHSSSDIIYDETKYPVTITVQQDGNALDASVQTKMGTKLTNQYIVPPKPVNVQVVFHKELSLAKGSAKGERTLQGNDFQFNLLQNGKVVETAYNDADGTITFGSLTFTKEGTYTYDVQEVKDGLKNITYNEQIYPVEITVTKDEDNQLQAAIDTPQGKTITNQYSIAPATTRIVFHKVLTGANDANDASGTASVDVPPLEAKQFSFQLVETSTAEDGTTKETVIDTATNDAKGQVAFKPLKYDEAGEYQYFVQEVDNQVPGVIYDQTKYPVVVTVEQNESALTAKVQTEHGTMITNQYKPARAAIVFQKELALTPGSVPETRTVKANEFQFQLLQEDQVIETAHNDANGKIAFTPLQFTKPGTYDYTVKEVNTGEDGIVYDDNSYPVQVVVTKDGDELSAAITTANGTTITNHYGTPPTPVMTHIIFNKVLAAQKADGTASLTDKQPLTDGQFEFQLIETKAGENGTTENVIDTASNDANGQIAFKTLTYIKPGTYTYVVQEINDHAEGVIYDQTKYPVTITVKENGKALEASIEAKQGKTITNLFKPAKAQIVFQKKLELTPGSVPETRTIKANEFQFQLLQGEKVIETVHNDEDGTITFSPLAFTKEGTYSYTVKEVDEGKQGTVYDQTAYPVEITVTRNGEKFAAVIKTAQGKTITNQYGTPPTPATVNLAFRKVLSVPKDTGAVLQNKVQLQADQFQFRLVETTTAADGTSKNTVVDTVSNDAKGQIAFDDLTFTKPGTYQYFVQEVKGNTPGLAYDQTQYPVTIVVSENGSKLEADVQTNKGTTITNRYQPAMAYIVFHKKLEKAPGSAQSTRGLQANDFQFNLLKDGEVIETAYNDDKGTIAFGPLSFTEIGTYTYSVQEVKDDLPGITYDTKAYPVEIQVTNQNGKLNAAINTPDENTIINQYSIAPAHARIVFHKVLTMPAGLERDVLQDNSQLQAQQFQFQLFEGPIPTSELTRSANGETTLIETVANDAKGQIAFKPLTFNEVGTYQYYIQEVDTDTDGITYDNTRYPVTITVSKNENILEAKITAGKGTTITNQYKPASAQIVFHKQLELTPGSVPETRTLKANEFQFNLLQDGQIIQTATNDADGSITFDPLRFTRTGTYEYSVQEVNTGEQGIVYDSKAYPVTITVSKDSTGLNAAIATKQGDTITNHYGTPPTPATAQILFQKVLAAKTADGASSTEKQPLEEGQFTFNLVAAQTAADGTDQNQIIDTVSNDANGQIVFTPLTFTKPGTYQYFVQEVNDKMPGIVYDLKKYPVTITITENGSALKADIKTDDGTTITNEFKPAKAQIVFQKALVLTPGSAPETRTVQANEFQFQLMQGNQVIETVPNDGEGTITFSPLEFTKEGTYIYTVQEVDEGAQDIVYDKTSYPVEITVTKTGQKFVADINTTKGKTITNHYGTPPTPAKVNLVFQKALTVDKDDQSLLQNHSEIRNKEFNFQLMEVHKDANGKVTSKQPVEKIPNDASGKIAFSPLTFSKPGTYYYSVHEIDDDKNKVPGIAYDQTEYPIAIVVSPSQDGAALQAEVQTPQGTTVTNKFVPAKAYIVFHKELQLADGSAKGARQLQDNEFQFNLMHDDKIVEAAYNDADGTIAFGPLSFIQEGTYAYSVQEVTDGDPGITYDETEYPVEIKVTDDGDDLKTAITTPQGDTITNQYSISPAEAHVVFHKELVPQPGTGYDNLDPGQTLPQLKDQQFEFQLVEQKTKPDGTTTDEVIETVRNDAKGQIAFSSRTFEQAGTYQYYVQEVGQDSDNLIYDKTKYPIVVTVQENDQALEAKVQTKQGTTITNQYVLPPKPAKAQIVFHKDLALAQGSAQGDRTLQENDYQFNLMQDGNVIETTFNQADGTVAFGPLTFNQEGKYMYTVQEVKDGLEGITYNDTVYSVNITVTKKGNELKADIQTPQGNTITNQYTITPAKARIVFQKRLVAQDAQVQPDDEQDLQDQQFQFNLVEKVTDPDGTAKENVIETVSNDANGQITFKQLAFTKPGTYQYYVQEIDTDAEGIVYDQTQYPVTITVKRSGQALIANMQTEQGTIITNQYVVNPKPATAQIVFYKKLAMAAGSAQESRALKGGDFKFNLIQNSQTIQSAYNEADGTITFAPLTFDHEGTYLYTVQEENDGISGITYDDHAYSVEIVVTKENNQLSAKVGLPQGDTITNQYSVAPATARVLFHKDLVPAQDVDPKSSNGEQTLQDQQFQFQLVEANGTGADQVIDTASNNAQGQIAFKPLTFDEAGTYQYFVQEIDTHASGIVYDQTQYPVTITVKDNGKSLDATMQASQGTTITNQYVLPPEPIEAKIVFYKKLEMAPGSAQENRSLKGNDFKFNLMKDGKVIETAYNQADGTITFEPLSFDQEGTYTYTVKEENEGISGIIYDDKTYSVEIQVTKDGNRLNAQINLPQGDTITNQYSIPPAHARIVFQKELVLQQNSGLPATQNQKQLQDQQFEFQLVEQQTNKVVETVRNDAKGQIAFKPLTFEKAGTYQYFVQEASGQDPDIIYDKTQYPVTITVKEIGQSLEADVQAAKKTTITNQYVLPPKPVKTQIVFHKKLVMASGSAQESRSLKGHDFKFNLNQNGQTIQSAYNEKDGTITFAPLTFDREGTYLYTVQEENEGISGIIYDDNAYSVEIVVTKDGEQLNAKINLPQGDTITNQYSVAPASVRVLFHKDLVPAQDVDAQASGKEQTLQDQQFLFKLVETDGTGANQVIDTVSNNAQGQIAFKPLTFDEAGKYQYFVQEINTHTSGIVYDETQYPVTITVKDNGKSLDANMQTSKGTTITNQYVLPPEPVKAQIVFYKELARAAGSAQESRSLKANDFQFNLMQDGKVVETAYNQADGKIAFEPLTFTKEGTYTYTVQEVNDGLEGITYDDKVYSVEIEVTKKDNELNAAIHTPQGEKITNQYSITPAHARIVFQKELLPTQDAMPVPAQYQQQLQGQQFEFQLIEKQTNKVVETVHNDAKGQIAFTPLTFKKPGTYQYVVQEISGQDLNIVYDEMQYPVTITVKENGQSLEAEVKAEQGMKITNRYDLPSTFIRAQIEFEVDLEKAADAPADTPTRTRKTHEFVFALKDDQGNILATTANDRNGKIRFSNVPVEPGGECIYTVVQIDQHENGITDDLKPRHVAVYGLSNKQRSQAVVHYPDGQVFINTYDSAEMPDPRNTRVQISGQKTLTGATLADGQFHFVLRGEGLELRASNGSDGKFYFLLPAYDQTGSHVYTIEEVNDGQSNITYDSTKYQAEVVVMNDKGELESHLILQKMNADGTVDQNAQRQDQAAFANTFTPSPTPPDDNPSTPDNPSKPDHPSTPSDNNNPGNSGKNNGSNGSNNQNVSPAKDQTKNTNPVNNTLNWTFNWPTIASGQNQSTKSAQNGSNRSSVKTASKTDAMMWFVLWILALAAMIILPVYSRREKSQK